MSQEINKFNPIKEDTDGKRARSVVWSTDTIEMAINGLGQGKKLIAKEHKEYYQRLIETPESNTLSPAALETLAIIAYNQPITRAEIDEMRGVNNVHMIRKLLAKGLIKEVGKSTMPGRPNQYGTTSEFLDYFGLSSIKELPLIVKEEEPAENEAELFTSIYKEDIMESVENE